MKRKLIRLQHHYQRMIQYVQNIIIPYVRNVRDTLNEDKATYLSHNEQF